MACLAGAPLPLTKAIDCRLHIHDRTSSPAALHCTEQERVYVSFFSPIVVPVYKTYTRASTHMPERYKCLALCILRSYVFHPTICAACVSIAKNDEYLENEHHTTAKKAYEYVQEMRHSIPISRTQACLPKPKRAPCVASVEQRLSLPYPNVSDEESGQESTGKKRCSYVTMVDRLVG